MAWRVRRQEKDVKGKGGEEEKKKRGEVEVVLEEVLEIQLSTLRVTS